MAGDAVDGLVLAGPDKPGWIHSPYPDGAVQMEPIVTDIAAALEAEGIGAMMLVNAVSPQLHLSIIETHLTAAALTEHLRRFIVVRNEAYKTYSRSLRFADCVVQSMLSAILSSLQWAAITGPFVRWWTHGRDGRIHQLPIADAAAGKAATPLILRSEQFDQCAAACLPNVYIAHIRAMRYGVALRGTCQQQHQWACSARELWRASGSSDELVLRWLIAAAIDSAGKALSFPGVLLMLAEGCHDGIREALTKAVAKVVVKPQKLHLPV